MTTSYSRTFADFAMEEVFIELVRNHTQFVRSLMLDLIKAEFHRVLTSEHYYIYSENSIAALLEAVSINDDFESNEYTEFVFELALYEAAFSRDGYLIDYIKEVLGFGDEYFNVWQNQVRHRFDISYTTNIFHLLEKYSINEE